MNDLSKLTPESRCQAGEEGTVVSRRGALPSSGSPSHAASAVERGLDPRPTSPTLQRYMVAASLLLGDRTQAHGCYPRRIPGSPRFC
jgi:hypothetical protein